MAVGERNLQRKLKALVGMTPGEYLREYRLQQAMERLRAGERPGDRQPHDHGRSATGTALIGRAHGQGLLRWSLARRAALSHTSQTQGR